MQFAIFLTHEAGSHLLLRLKPLTQRMLLRFGPFTQRCAGLALRSTRACRVGQLARR
jgi:hypothetical protein